MQFYRHLSYAFVWPFVGSSALLPPAFAFSLPRCGTRAVSQSDHVLTIIAHTIAPTARCPRCGTSSQRIHSYYTRCPHDLPLWEYAVRLVLHVPRFRCLNASCTAQTFAEKLPRVVRPAAQLTCGAGQRSRPSCAPPRRARTRRLTPRSRVRWRPSLRRMPGHGSPIAAMFYTDLKTALQRYQVLKH
jgi:zinc-finger of transposase IS204/IS1001/IS1096/IS1165